MRLCTIPQNYVALTELFHIPIVIRVPDVRAQTQDVLRGSRLHVTVAQEREPVLVAVCVVVIFPSWCLDRLEEVDRLCKEASQHGIGSNAGFSAKGLLSVLSSDRTRARSCRVVRMSMTYRARPQINPVLGIAILEPTAAFFLPHCRLVILIKVSVDFV